MKKLIIAIIIILAPFGGCKQLDECSESLTKKNAIIAVLEKRIDVLKADKDYSNSTNGELRKKIAELKVKITEKDDEIKNLTLKNIQLEFENMIMQELIKLITEKCPDIMDQITGN